MALRYVFNPFTGNFDLVDSASTPSATTFTLANNQTSFADVTGFLVDPTADHAFSAEISAERYNTGIIDYTEDTAFYTNLGSSFNSQVNKIAVQADQKSLIGGDFTSFNGNTRNRLVRLNSDGTEDTAFYTNLGTGFNNSVKWIIVQADQKIVVGGDFTDLNGSTRNRLVRLNSDGTEDTTFYTNLGTGFDDLINTIAEQSNNQLVVGGAFLNFNGNARNRFVRLNSDGTEDTTFYTNLGSAFGGIVFASLVQADQKIVVSGAFLTFNGNLRNRIVRLNTDGTEDTTFATNVSIGADNTVVALALQPDQKILAGGIFNSFNVVTRHRLVRLNTDGTDDTTFNTNVGAGLNNVVFAIEVTAGNVVLVGGTFTLADGVSRVKAAAFDSNGILNTQYIFPTLDNSVFTFGVQANDQILTGGSFTAADQYLLRFINLTAQASIVQETLRGIFNVVSGSWTLMQSGFPSTSTGITLNMTDAGQLQYKTTDFSGTVVTSLMKFLITRL